LFNNIIKYFI